MESSYNNISQVYNVTFSFQRFKKKFNNVKNIELIHVDSEKSINSFEIKKG